MKDLDPMCKCGHRRSYHDHDEYDLTDLDPTYCIITKCPCKNYRALDAEPKREGGSECGGAGVARVDAPLK